MSILILEKDNFKGAFGPFLLSLEEIQPFLLNAHLSERETVKLIKDMSHKFTQRRDLISEYVLDENYVSAYSSFYLPTNIPKLHFLLSKLNNEMIQDISYRPFIDYGCGPGTFSLGMHLMLPNSNREYICIDSSKMMLEQAKSFLEGFKASEKREFRQKYHEEKSEGVLFFGHSINELGISKAIDIVLTINPEYVLFIEPGTNEIFKELKNFRKSLLEHYSIVYPCPSQSDCPSDWCHQVLRSTHDNSVERLGQLVSLDRKTQALVAHVYKRNNNPIISNKNTATIIRFINETKFSFEYQVCMEDGESEGRELVNRTIEILKKDLSKEEEKSFKKSNIGDQVNFEIIKIVNNHLRVKLINN